MAAIYKPHMYMLSRFPGTTVLFGMPFMKTMTAMLDFGPAYKHFGLGTKEDLEHLEAFLAEEKAQGRKVQAIWTEFPSNPLLDTPDVERLHQLADKYDVVLAIDDTIGGWANVDVTAVADMLVTSITKSFSGYADVMAGSVILNPSSPRYHALKSLFDGFYIPELYVDDAEAVETNSRDYLSRTAKLNANAGALVAYLESCAQRAGSTVSRVYYPPVNPSGAHYRPYMRQPTADLTPGYGCVFSVELEDMAATRAFYENLNVHKSVHLGAPATLALAYVMCTYGTRMEWAEQYGLRPTQIRVSAGLENTEMLLQDFQVAVEAADASKSVSETAARRQASEAR
jgi:cystathionine gamma-synthase